jgi:hypothetical protein
MAAPSSGTGEGGVGRQDLAAVCGGQRVEGAACGFEGGRVGLGFREEAAQVGAARADQESGGLPEGTKAGALLSRVKALSERPPAVGGRHHRGRSHEQQPDPVSKVSETLCLSA